MGDEKLPEAQERTTENPVFQKSATGRIKRIIVFQPAPMAEFFAITGM
jgi:hypothetical protein